MPEDVQPLPPSPRARRHGSSIIPGPPRSRRSSQAAPPPISDDTTGPLRHPRPMTAAELHLEVEKEQEALVNRLTRELSELRAQTSSVASTTSTTSASSILEQAISETGSTSLTSSGIIHPTASRTHRSSSSVSSRSVLAGAMAVPGTSQASVDRARDAAGIRSRTNSLLPPSLASVSAPVPPRDFPSPRSRAESLSRSPISQQFSGSTHAPSASPTFTTVSFLTQSPARHEEVAVARSALEAVRKENETLASRVRELEATLRARNLRGTTIPRSQHVRSQNSASNDVLPNGTTSTG